MVAIGYEFAGGSRLPQSLLAIATIAPYLPFFAIGILARTHKPTTPLGALLLTLCFIEAAMVTLLTAFDGSTDVAGAVVTTMLCVLLLAGLIGFANGLPIPHVPVLSRGLAGVGFISFSWYLVHENLGVSFLSNLNRLLPNWLAVPVTIGATLLIAWVFSELVEWRFRKPAEALALRVLNGAVGIINRVRGKTALARG
jgi:peptidoglycan/LPS O-acetylase OafA/YrhL